LGVVGGEQGAEMGMRQEARLRRFFGVLSYEMSFWESRCAVGAMLGNTTTVFRQWNGFRDTSPS
jgi:predicted branched-subunit amino acid permease